MKVARTCPFFQEQIEEQDFFIFLGPSGTGKTEVSLNLAVYLHDLGFQVRIVDLDLTKTDFTIRSDRVVLPFPIEKPVDHLRFSPNPTISKDLVDILSDPNADKTVIDLGGGELGVKIFCSLKNLWQDRKTHLSLVVNFARPFFEEEVAYSQFISQINSWLPSPLDSIVANSHLMQYTDWNMLWESWLKVKAVSTQTDIPVFFLSVWEKVIASNFNLENFDTTVVKIKRFIELP